MTIMKSCALTIAAAFAAIAVAASPTLSKQSASASRLEPTSFRGVTWGATRAEALAVLGLEDHCTDMSDRPDESEIWCGQDFDMGAVRATARYVFVEDKMVSVRLSYSPSDMEYVKTAFVAKYGKPTSTTNVPVQNAHGARYNDIVTVWNFPRIRIEMHLYGPSLSRGITYLTDKRAETDRDRKRAASAKRAKDSF